MAKGLCALVALATSGAEASERGELFTAWRRFLEGVACDRPLVMVLEDLHWADPLMLEFVVRFAVIPSAASHSPEHH
jgi:predicted ATPase